MHARILALLMMSAAWAAPTLAGAQPAAVDHAAHAGMGKPAASAPAAATTDGEVRKVDKANARITLAHGEIRNLSMPGMTMAFGVKDKAWLDKVKVGDKVRFTAANEGGKLVLTSLEPAR